MTQQDNYVLVLAPPARRAIAEQLPQAVATAVIDFVTTALLENPRRLGKPLRGNLAGIWAARRGTYRILYRILDAQHEILILRIEHRSQAYRPR